MKIVKWYKILVKEYYKVPYNRTECYLTCADSKEQAIEHYVHSKAQYVGEEEKTEWDQADGYDREIEVEKIT